MGWPIAEALYTQRRDYESIDAKTKQQSERLNVAFNKLVHEVDYALRAFQRHMEAALGEQIDRGTLPTSWKASLTDHPPQRKTEHK